MEEINHFSHENHPLKLINSKTIVGVSFDGGDITPQVIGCYACEKPISSGFAYACIQCCYFLHKACAQLPHTINDPSLYYHHHPLTLTDMKNTDSRSRQCDVCRIRKTPGVFSYIFIKDNKYTFVACIDCCVARISLKAEVDAIKEEPKIKVQHEGHPHHTLTLQLRPAALRCDACNSKDEGLFYECDSCDFWIHKTCASLASTINLPHHPNHPLVLVYSLSEKFFNFPYYYPLKLLHFEKMSRVDDEKTKIKHWSHHHPLILTVEAQANNMSCSSDLIEHHNPEICLSTKSVPSESQETNIIFPPPSISLKAQCRKTKIFYFSFYVVSQSFKRTQDKS
uniref:DC1 domain-containing protein n=1 Tax=Lactuca sativa TaxID=4236 RepID=A0A9R1V998_LACSA|nr:hypothetical protein LSAT_V11C600329140 [Lactuca sativa]